MDSLGQSYGKNLSGSIPDGGYYPKFIGWRRDPRFVKMMMKYGHEGAGIHWDILDFLREQDQYSATMESIPEIAYLLHADAGKLSSVITDFDLFHIADGVFLSPWLSTALLPLDEKRRKQSEAGRRGNDKRWSKGSVPDQDAIGARSVPDQDAIASKVKKSRVKESKKEDSKQEQNLLRESFEVFWELYDKKSDRKSTEKVWISLTDDERVKATGHAAEYVLATPDKQYRKDPATYLRNKSFENEIIARKSGKDAGSQQLLASLTSDLRILGTSAARVDAARKW